MAEASRAALLQDQLREANAELGALRAQADKSAEEARNAVRMTADWLAQQLYGVKIFGTEGPSLPEQAPNAEILDKFNSTQGRRRGRDVVREAEEQFAQAMREMGRAANS